MHSFKYGDILASSWGATMQMVSFYQVIRATPAMITIRRIGSVETSTGFLEGTCVPDATQYKLGHKFNPATKRMESVPADFKRRVKKGYDGKDCVIGEYSSERVYLWDGAPMHFNHCD